MEIFKYYTVQLYIMVFLRYNINKGIKYWYFAEEYYENGKHKQRCVLWIGNTQKLYQLLTKTSINLEDIKITQVQNYGEILALHKIFSEFDLVQKINDLMPKARGNGVDVGNLTEIMVINALVAQKRKNGIKKWYEETILPKLLGIRPEQLYSQLFCRALDYFTKEKIEILEKQITSYLQERYKFEIKKAFYDITSVYFEGDKCPIAEFGYSRDGKLHKKQIVVGLVLISNKKFPILYKIYKGNTADISTTKEVMEQLNQMYKIQDVVMIFDRGMISDKVRLQFHEMNIRYISALDGDSKEAKDLILSTPRRAMRALTLKNGRKVFVKRHIGSIKSLREKFRIKHTKRKENKELDEIEFLYLVGKSPEISKIKKDAHYEAVSSALKSLKQFQDELDKKGSSLNKKGRPIDIDRRIKQILHGVSQYFKCNWEKIGNNIKINIRFNNKNLRIARKIKGKFVLCASDSTLTNREILQGYIDKYQIEQVFRFLKSDV
ncbi:MAG: IS1634 family transposase, partial [Candidatus Helarchaeota archaeon]